MRNGPRFAKQTTRAALGADGLSARSSARLLVSRRHWRLKGPCQVREKRTKNPSHHTSPRHTTQNIDRIDTMTQYPGQRHVFGPLTTTFTPPADCTVLNFEDFYALEKGFSLIAALPNQQNCDNPDAESRNSCYPLNTALYTVGSQGFYSPAFECPLGWIAALTFNEEGYFHSSTTIGPVDWRFTTQHPLSTLLPGETGIICCPS